MLIVTDLAAGYGFLEILHGVSLRVEEGEMVALLGPNGAGKSTTLRCIAGLLPVSAGDIRFRDASIRGWPAHRVSRRGVSLVPEALHLFTGMNVRENLLLGGYCVRDSSKARKNEDFVYDLFPRLAERRRQLAGTLSGGERKMLAIGRALMGSPTLLLIDEPSLGLHARLASDVFAALRRLPAEGLTILLVEQNVPATLEMADRAYVLERGQIVLSGPASELAQSAHVREVYLGVDSHAS